MNILRDPPDENQLNDGEDALKERGKSPGPVTSNVCRAKCEPSADESSDIPQAVVYCGNPGAMLRVGDLGEKHWARELGH